MFALILVPQIGEILGGGKVIAWHFQLFFSAA
jgi:hypothetical protein